MQNAMWVEVEEESQAQESQGSELVPTHIEVRTDVAQSAFGLLASQRYVGVFLNDRQQLRFEDLLALLQDAAHKLLIAACFVHALEDTLLCPTHTKRGESE